MPNIILRAAVNLPPLSPSTSSASASVSRSLLLDGHFANTIRFILPVFPLRYRHRKHSSTGWYTGTRHLAPPSFRKQLLRRLHDTTPYHGSREMARSFPTSPQPDPRSTRRFSRGGRSLSPTASSTSSHAPSSSSCTNEHEPSRHPAGSDPTDVLLPAIQIPRGTPQEP